MENPGALISSIAAKDATRARKLQLLGILSGFAAGAWLGAAEAPTKLVTVGVSPVVISLIMVIGVFLARWSLPALILGTSRAGAAFDSVGVVGGLPVGGGEHADDLRDPRYRPQHSVSVMEFEQLAGHPVGISFLQ